MSRPSAEDRELLDLLDALREQTITHDRQQRLHGLIAGDVKALRLYNEYMFLASALRWSHAVSTNSPQPHATKTPIVSLLGTLARGIPGGTFTVGVLIVLVVVAAFWGLALQLFNPRDQSLAVVATIRDSVDVRWSSKMTSPIDHSAIEKGQRLDLTSGQIELQLTNGVQLVVDGPAQWTVYDPNQVSLQLGKLVAKVPSSATGFTIKTAHANIVDLGTEFSVLVDSNGAAEVLVLDGKVAIRPNEQDRQTKSFDEQLLTAGMARKIEATPSGIAVTVQATHHRNSHKPRASAQFQPIAIRTVLASCEEEQHPAIDLLNGKGLTGNRHSAVTGMWRTPTGRWKREFLLFDLGRRYRLESAKIWNYNDPKVRSAGVAQGDFYTSITGQGDPLSQPDAWTLLIPDRWLRMADGADSYQSPDVVSFGGAVGRFVAIVIKDHFARDPRSANAPPDYVGLSEVQFFSSPKIGNIIDLESATASSSDRNAPLRVPANVVNDSGIVAVGSNLATDGAFLHDNIASHMWLVGDAYADGGALGQSITIDLGALYHLNGMRIWNFNQRDGGSDSGISIYDLHTSSDSQNWMLRQHNQLLQRAPGDGLLGYKGVYTAVQWPNVRYVRITIVDTYRDRPTDDIAGLAEVMFTGAAVSNEIDDGD
jgi:hypothetical protein